MDRDWYQQALTPPQVIQATLRVGWIPSENHLQWHIDVQDPTTSVLIAQESSPHVGNNNVRALLEECSRRMLRLLEETAEPF